MLSNIKNINILKIVIEKLKKKLELNLLKYNKKFMNKLNITKQDFENFIDY